MWKLALIYEPLVGVRVLAACQEALKLKRSKESLCFLQFNGSLLPIEHDDTLESLYDTWKLHEK